ncbi:MAG: hypothetical protein AB1349_01340 [Elusimicrobiota bacterium]
MNDSDTDTTPLNDLDTEAVLTFVSKNIFGFKKVFNFFNVHFEYKNLFSPSSIFGTKKKVPYSSIKQIICSKNNIKIQLYDKKRPIRIYNVENITEKTQNLKNLTGF